MDEAPPPRGPEEIAAECRDGYGRLLANLDAFHATVLEMYRAHIACRAGCFSCCKTRLSVFPIEADALRRSIAEMPPELHARLRERLENDEGEAASFCALLVDGACSVYRDRPMLCRIHGLPNASTSYPTGAIDFCELNFTELAADDIEPAAVLDWDHAGRALALLNFKLTQATGGDPRGRLRIPILEIAREGVGLPPEALEAEPAIPVECPEPPERPRS